MKLKLAAIIALVLSIAFSFGWESYWRSQGRVPNIDDNKDLWAIERAKLMTPDENQVVFVGSSRILFDIQKPVWRNRTETEPIILGIQGSTPLPQLKNLLEETEFRGLIIVGVTPDIFFWSDKPQSFSWDRAQSFIDYFNDRTYAQRINHHLSRPLQENLAFFRDGAEAWDDDVDLKTLLIQMRSGTRAGELPPPFYLFEKTAFDRNVEMSSKTENDTALANSVIRAWGLDEWEKEIEDKEAYEKTMQKVKKKRAFTLDYFLEYAKSYVEEGGEIILVRCPSSGQYRKVEKRDFPREHFWDSLVIKSGLPAFHFEDYPQLMRLDLPELSHLSKKDADYFTEELIKILQEYGHLPNTKKQK